MRYFAHRLGMGTHTDTRTHTHARTHAHTHTHPRTRARTHMRHTYTHTQIPPPHTHTHTTSSPHTRFYIDNHDSHTHSQAEILLLSYKNRSPGSTNQTQKSCPQTDVRPERPTVVAEVECRGRWGRGVIFLLPCRGVAETRSQKVSRRPERPTVVAEVGVGASFFCLLLPCRGVQCRLSPD